MPVNKNAYIRYRIIDACLRDKENSFPTKEYIIKKCRERADSEVSDSTFEKDIQAMRKQNVPGFFAPIKYDKRHNGYFYDDPAYSIESFGVKTEDPDAIEFGAALLQQYKNSPMLCCYAPAIDKIMCMINARKIADTDELNNFICPDIHPQFNGAEQFEAVLAAIKSKTVLSIAYRTLTSEKPWNYLIHPYLLREYRDRWFLIGLDQKKNKIRALCLEMIMSMTPENKVEFTGGDFDINEYCNKLLGITATNRQPEIIRLQVKNKKAWEIIDTPLHKSQEIELREEKYSILRYELIPNDEFISEILAMGCDVKILEPPKLIKRIEKKLKKCLKNYRKK